MLHRLEVGFQYAGLSEQTDAIPHVKLDEDLDLIELVSFGRSEGIGRLELSPH